MAIYDKSSSSITFRVPSSPTGPDWSAHTDSKPCYMELAPKYQLRQGFINPGREKFWRDARKKCLKPEHPASDE